MAGNWPGNMLEDLPKAAPVRALESHHPEIHHSDQRVQYAATGYVSLMQVVHAQISMAAQRTPTENGYSEWLIHTLKEEEVSLHDYEDLNEARANIAHFLDEVYMTKRVHSALDYLPPIVFDAQWKAEHLETGGPKSLQVLGPVQVHREFIQDKQDF